MPSRTTPHVQDPHPGLQAEQVDQELNLLGGAFGERVPQVRLAGVIGDRLELPAGDLDGESLESRMSQAARQDWEPSREKCFFRIQGALETEAEG